MLKLFYFFIFILKTILTQKIATTSTLLGQLTSGPTNGIGTNARFNQPFGISISKEGNYAVIADQNNHLIRKVDLLTKRVTILAGGGSPDSTNGIGTNSRFNSPGGIKISLDNSLILVGELTNTIIRSINSSTTEVQTIAGRATIRGSFNGIGTNSLFNTPIGVVISSNRSFALVADQFNNMIRHINLQTFEVKSFAGQTFSGVANGIGTYAKFHSPIGIDISFDDSFALVADRDNNMIRKITISTAYVETITGRNKGAADGIGTFASFNQPLGVSISPDLLYALIADTNNHVIRRIILSTLAVDTLAGQFSIYGSTNGIGTNALYYNPYGIDISKTGNFALVADTGNNLIRYIDLMG